VFAFALESEGGGGYTSQTRLPTYFPPTGINTGVALIHIRNWPADLTTEINYVVKTAPRQHLKLGDQDLLNIILHQRKEMVHLLHCSWNLRPWSYWACDSPHWSRAIIHASDGTFYDTEIPRKEIFTRLYAFTKSFVTYTGVNVTKPRARLSSNKRGRPNFVS
jgi:lipopolysaccharide biosynthesis glycosyltransferase